MKKYLIDFWFYDENHSLQSRRTPIFSGYRPNMFILGDHKNLKSTPFTLIGKKESVNPGFRGLVLIESDFDLKETNIE
jgi:hypothetical protein